MTQTICLFGEVLYDHFPDGSQVLGGAPFNVAWNLQGLGQAARLISRIGQDAEGQAIIQAMRAQQLPQDGLQQDAELPTGKVNISLNAGEPSYDIVAPCAYDRVEPPEANAAACDLLYHGTLALRDPVSRTTLEQLIEQQQPQVFLDVNLRSPWWEKNQVLAWVARAHWVKLNQDELGLLGQSAQTDTQAAQAFLQTHNLHGLVVTRGAQGAELLTRGGGRYTTTPPTAPEVVDTVGAGDAFAAVILLGLLRKWPLQQTLDRAQQFAAAQVGQRGATVADSHYYQAFIDNWS